MLSAFYEPSLTCSRLVFTGTDRPISELECEEPATILTGDPILVAEVVDSLWNDSRLSDWEEVS